MCGPWQLSDTFFHFSCCPHMWRAPLAGALFSWILTLVRVGTRWSLGKPGRPGIAFCRKPFFESLLKWLRIRCFDLDEKPPEMTQGLGMSEMQFSFTRRLFPANDLVPDQPFLCPCRQPPIPGLFGTNAPAGFIAVKA